MSECARSLVVFVVLVSDLRVVPNSCCSLSIEATWVGLIKPANIPVLETRKLAIVVHIRYHVSIGVKKGWDLLISSILRVRVTFPGGGDCPFCGRGGCGCAGGGRGCWGLLWVPCWGLRLVLAGALSRGVQGGLSS